MCAKWGLPCRAGDHDAKGLGGDGKRRERDPANRDPDRLTLPGELVAKRVAEAVQARGARTSSPRTCVASAAVRYTALDDPTIW